MAGFDSMYVSGKMCSVEYGRITMCWNQRITTNVVHKYKRLRLQRIAFDGRNCFGRVLSFSYAHFWFYSLTMSYAHAVAS